MDEDKSTHEKSPVLSSKTKGRGRPRVCEQIRSSFRVPSWKSKFKVETKWPLTEKTRLLEALKRYEPHNISNITKLVGTKTEEEVEEKIKSLRGVNSFKGSSDRVDGPDAEQAPLETWIDLVQELTKNEPADYSQFIPKILGLIARNEQFADSGYPQLKWRNIYQFLADITEDRVEVQKLTDMESLVVLDMMHSLGDTLLKSDTSQQRLIMDLKYNLLNFKSDNPLKWERESNNQRIAQALSNEFWDFQGVTDVTFDAPCSSASSSHQSENSSQKRNMTEVNSESTSSMVSNSTVRSNTQIHPGSSNIVSRGMPETCMTTDLSTSIAGAGHQNRIEHSYEQPINCSESDSNESSFADAEANLSDSGINLPGAKFEHPKFLTLNPLCVPLPLIAFRPKAKDKQ